MSSFRLDEGEVFAGAFRVLRPLSEGGMGAVYVVEQIATGARRALKVMHPQLLADDRARERFVQEARVGARVKSDHVVHVLDAGLEPKNNVPWLVMELLEGESLGGRLERGRPTTSESIEVLVQICHALGAAHDVGIVHRDLKPENVFLAETHREGVAFTAKVLDFGIAKWVEEANARTTAAIGTPLWMAPEQTIPGSTIAPATDVWALGLVAFRMLCGVCYWKAASAESASAIALLREISFEPLPPASERARELMGTQPPEGFDAWFARCVERDVTKRFANAREARAAMESGWGDARDTRATHDEVADLALARTAPLTGTEVTARVSNDTGEAAASRTTGAWKASPTPTTGRNARFAWIGLALVAATAIAWKMRWGRDKTDDTSTAPKSSTSASASNVSTNAPTTSSATSTTTASIATNATGGKALCPDDMSKIPGGSFTPANGGAHVDIAPFCLDQLEVDVRRYAECADKKSCPPPQSTTQIPIWTQDEIDRWSKLCNFGRPDHLDHPMNCVDWSSADAFCKSLGRRLPREEEWEWAARNGPEGTQYPWGNEVPPVPGKKLLCWAPENSELGTCPVGSFLAGINHWSVFDLSGNVREWTSNDYEEDPGKKIYRGGCFGVHDPADERATVRAWMLPTNRLHVVGFRCAIDVAK
jgi:serine/threonine protein kinase